jgi:tetratricopeptide (TPR) repeat protein
MPDAAATFVGREPELEQLLGALRSAVTGKGSTIFLSGEAGLGKQTLLDEVARRAEGDPELAAIAFVTGTCQREHEGQNPYEPFAEILVSLVATGPVEKAKHALIEVLKEMAPDWLGMIPVVGAGVGAGVKTALRVREVYRGEADEERERLAQDRAAQFLAALGSRLERGPVALVIAHAQWIDGPSASLLERVARFAADHPVLVVVVSRPDRVGPDQVLRVVEDELVIDDLASRIDLTGLDDAGVGEFVRALRGRGLAPDVAGWLREFTAGNPMFVAHLVPVLEESGILVARGDVYAFDGDASVEGGVLSLAGRLAGVALPPSVTRAVERRLAELAGDDRELLEIASVEGRRFLSSTLVQVAELEERELLKTLGEVEKLHGMIRAQPVVQRRRYAYEFTNLLLQQQMYAGLSEPQRVDYHCAVAEALVATFGEGAPRPVLLDVARHFEEGCDPGAAARYLLPAAESALLDGASPQAAALCVRGLTLAREADDRELDRTRAELVQLLVSASDISWTGEIDLEALLAEGKAAAARCGDDELQARLLHAEGNLIFWTRDVRESRQTLEAALELARKAEQAGSEGALLTVLAIMIDLGNAIDVDSIDEGLAMLREAHELYVSRLQAQGDPDPALARLGLRLEGFMGVGEFDRGNLGEARRLLDHSIEGLDAIGVRSDLPRFLNYRAQVALARGDFAAAEADLRQALDGAEPGVWAFYNTAMIGKVFLDAERYDEAGSLIRAGWSDLQAAWRPSLGLVGRAYLVEFLLRTGSSAAEVEEAAPLVDDEVRDATDGKFEYFVVWGESLAAELALRRGDPAAAVEHGRRSVELLDRSGDHPIVRSEEVLWRYARCLTAAGLPEADELRKRARAVVARKAATLPEEDATRMWAVTPTARALTAVGESSG